MIKPPGGGLFRILGPVQVWTGDAWADIQAPKWRALLAMLLLHPGQPVSTDRLIAELWGDEPPGSAVNLVSVYMHRLRHLIGDTHSSVLVRRSPGYQAVLNPGDLDAEMFASLIAEGRQALTADEPAKAAGLLAAAIACWGGPPLADVPPTPLVTAEIDRLEQARIEAHRWWAEAGLACGRPAEVAAEVRRLLAEHPLREEIWALLIRALLQDGRQAEALEAYSQARKKISDELGVDPGAELQQLYQQILNADTDNSAAIAAGRPARAAPSPAQLPADILDFTGRVDQVDQVRALLSGEDAEGSPGAVRVVLLMGAGGLGKTTLAVHAAHLLADQFPDGQLYANLLGATQPAEPAEVLARFLRVMGVDGADIPLGEEERAAHFRTRLAGKRVLLVLDDARDAAQVRPLLPGSSSCAVLVTSRGRLPELAGIGLLDLEVLPPDEAQTMFERVAGAARVRAEPDAAAEVLTACAGLPLAIRIAGAKLAARGGWSVRTLADRLADERRRLDEFRVGNMAIRASFEVSFTSLLRPEGAGAVDPAQAFRLLGLWQGPSISLRAAAALIGEPETAVADALDVLVDAHLLESPGADQFRFHDLLRVYAAERARSQESEADRLAAVTRLLSWYVHTTEAAATTIAAQRRHVPLGDPLPGTQPRGFTTLDEGLAWCEYERVRLTAAVRQAAEYGLYEFAWQMPAAANSFYYRRSHFEDWVTTHLVGLAGARALGDKRAEAWMLNNLGMAYGKQRKEQAFAYFEQALEIYGGLGESAGERRTANNIANAYFDVGRYEEALVAAERSLAVQRRVKSRYGEGIAIGILGGSCRELGRLTEAVEYVKQAIVIFRETGDQDAEADALADLGETYLRLEQVDDAIECLSDSLTIRNAIGNRYGLATTLRSLGHAQQRAGQNGQARQLLSAAMAVFEELRDHAQAAEVRATLAAVTGPGH
jgi:DNA-binding SARP family transcriptional activator